jgi:uncharacterized protein YjiS (DUF1127 family)
MLPKPQSAPSSLDRAIAALLSSFMEGFALFAMLHLPATPIDEPFSARAEPSEKMSAGERRRSLAIVSSSTRPEVTGPDPENDANRTGSGSEALSSDADLVPIYRSHSFDADRSNYRNRPTKYWSAVAGRWWHWRREREVKKAVATLVELDDRTLRDIGIPHRSQIEHAVRYGRNGSDLGRRWE